MKILSVLVVIGKKYRNLAELHWNLFLHRRSNPVSERRGPSERLSAIGSPLICVCVWMFYVYFTLSLRMPNKTKKWISCVCQSSSRFTNNNNYFCIVKLRGSPGHCSALDGLVTPNEKSTNWNGGSISIVCGWLALKPPKTVKSTSGKLSSHKKSDFNINLRFFLILRGTKIWNLAHRKFDILERKLVPIAQLRKILHLFSLS